MVQCAQNPHCVTVSVLACTIAIVLIVGSILSLVKRDTFVARRKATQYPTCVCSSVDVAVIESLLILIDISC